MKKWPRFLKNKYILTLLIFGVWIVVFDSANNVSRQYNLYRQKVMLQQTVNEKKKEIETVRRKIQMLKDKNSLERFAREEFRFKRPNEEIFVIVADE